MASDDNLSTPRKYRPSILRFSLRSLMLATFFCCVSIGAWSVFVNPFRLQMKQLIW